MIIKVRPGRIKTTGKEIFLVTSPYDPDFVERARALGGRWQQAGEWWVFDQRDEHVVRDALVGVYGTDGTDDAPLVDVELDLPGDGRDAVLDYLTRQSAASWIYHGRDLARRASRDAPVRFGEGVRLLAGPPFSGSGGSARYPSIGCNAARTLLIRDVPAGIYERDKVRFGDAIRLHVAPTSLLEAESTETTRTTR